MNVEHRIERAYRRIIGTVLAIALALSALPAQTVFAQAAFSVPREAVMEALVKCTDPVLCRESLGELIAALALENPDMPIETVIAAVVRAIGGAYNDGTASPDVVQVALVTAANIASEQDLIVLVASIEEAAANVADGAPIEVENVLDGSASPA